MRRYAYTLLDVFTSRPLEGNQLAVFTDARGLSDAEMQRIAKETNLSETTFILPGDAAQEREQGTRVRIFTVSEELPFAGHPTLGTANVLRKDGAARVELALNVGKVPVTFDASGFGEMRQRDPKFGETHAREQIARISGLNADDIREDVPAQTVSTGLPFVIVPVKTLAAMKKIVIDARGAETYLVKSEAKFMYFISRETEGEGAHVHARMIFYNGEDPATGSAAGCAAAWMARYNVAESGKRVMIEQGIECIRPSQIYVSAEKSGDSVVNVLVGGHAVMVGKGELLLH